MTRAERTKFNERARHQEATNSVVYQTYTAVQDWEQVFRLLRLPWPIIFLRRAGWWRLSIFREKRRYEADVRDIYLQIARNVSEID